MSHSTPSRFLQIHTLTSYPAALLNRDDAGFAKRLPFGGAVRTRISSQCLKRHWRTAGGEHSLARIPGPGGEALPMTVRSRRTFDQEIFRPLKDEGVDQALAQAIVEALMAEVLQISKRRSAQEKETSEDDPGKEFHTGQVLVLGRPEVEYMLSEARRIAAEHSEPKAAQEAVKDLFKKDGKKNFEALTLGAGLDAALFGRMITSDILARGDAAIHVAHAFTVHGESSESDYFSAVDELAREQGETGSGHINSSELTSGLYYSYVVVDVPLLVSNLTGARQQDWTEADRDLAAEVVQRLVHLMATVTPGAKLGSTAPYSRAQLMVVEAGDEAPRTLANAFLTPVRSTGSLVQETYRALATHLAELDEVYGGPGHGRQGLALGPREELAAVLPEPTNLRSLGRWAAERVST